MVSGNSTQGSKLGKGYGVITNGGILSLPRIQRSVLSKRETLPPGVFFCTTEPDYPEPEYLWMLKIIRNSLAAVSAVLCVLFLYEVFHKSKSIAAALRIAILFSVSTTFGIGSTVAVCIIQPPETMKDRRAPHLADGIYLFAEGVVHKAGVSYNWIPWDCILTPLDPEDLPIDAPIQPVADAQDIDYLDAAGNLHTFSLSPGNMPFCSYHEWYMQSGCKSAV